MHEPSGDSWRRVRVARAWLLGAFVLLAAAAAIGAYEGSSRLERIVPGAVQLAHQADRSTYLVGEVAHRVDDVTAALDEKPGDPPVDANPMLAKNLARLDAAMDELPNFLDGEDRSTFEEIVPRIRAFHDGVAAVRESSRSGYTRESRKLYETRVLPVTAALERPLDRLVDLNATESERLIAQLGRDLDRARSVQEILGGTYVVFIALVAMATLRVIDVQHEALSRRMAEIEQANRDLDAFAGRVAHDLRGPLSPLALAAAQLRSPAISRERRDELANRITSSVERANTLIESLLTFSRTGSGPDPAVSSFAPDVVAHALAAVSDTAARADVALSSDVPPLRVAIDASLLEQVLDNLLRNAIRYMGVSSRRSVRVTVERRGNAVRFGVADTGPGVPENARDRIFEPFFRVDPRYRGGSGLGLATARRIVEAQGGAIGVEDNTGGGAIFWFSLPFWAEPHAKREHAA
jgi:two-component system OmpR family sensor kinase